MAFLALVLTTLVALPMLWAGRQAHRFPKSTAGEPGAYTRSTQDEAKNLRRSQAGAGSRRLYPTLTTTF